MSWIGKYKTFWQQRLSSRGEDRLQTTKVCNLVRSCIPNTQTYQSAVDLGCGAGRFLPLLSAYCRHVWAVDIVPSVVPCILARGSNITPYIVSEPFTLPSGPHDFVFVAFVLQHLMEDEVFVETVDEIRRVTVSGSRIMVLDNATDKAAHVRPRAAEDITKALGLSSTTVVRRVTVNKRENDHWLIDGCRV